MKVTMVLTAMAIGGVSACGGPAEVTDPYADLGENSLLVRFEANPELAEGQCNPNMHYALRTTNEAILINANYEVVDQNLTGSGFSIFDDERTGVARNTVEFNMFDPYPMDCAELQVRVQEISCRLESESDSQPCPSPVFEGTEMFAGFRGLPND